ncbi:hypothetical protein [Weissella sagaensis]|nr:hypothetical protein [Weissella sagaensis]
MKRLEARQKMYGVYDKEGLPFLVDDKQEEMTFTNLTAGSFASTISRMKKGKRKHTNSGYSIVELKGMG